MSKPVWGFVTFLVLGAGVALARFVVFGGMMVGAEGLKEAGVGANPEQIKQTEAYRAAAQVVSLDQGVLQAIGEPMTFGTVSVKHDSADEISLDLELLGKLENGHAQIDIEKPNGKHGWQAKGGDFFPAQGPPLHIRPQRR